MMIVPGSGMLWNTASGVLIPPEEVPDVLCDSLATNVELLMYMDDYSAFTDEKENEIVVGGGPIIVNSVSKFGLLCGYFNGSTDYLAFAPDAFDLSTGNWCFEMFVGLLPYNTHILFSKWVNEVAGEDETLPIQNWAVSANLVSPADEPLSGVKQIWGIQPFYSGSMPAGWATHRTITFKIRDFDEYWLPQIVVACSPEAGFAALLNPLYNAITQRADIMALVSVALIYSSGQPQHIEISSLVYGQDPYLITCTTTASVPFGVRTLVLGTTYAEIAIPQISEFSILALQSSAVIEADWTFTFNIDTVSLSYVTVSGDTPVTIAAEIVDLINASAAPVVAGAVCVSRPDYVNSSLGAYVTVIADVGNTPFSASISGTYEAPTLVDAVKGLQLGVDEDNKPFIVVSDDGTTDTTITSSTAIDTLTWTHLAYVKKNSTYSIYADGVLLASDTGPGTINSISTHGWLIGSMHSAAPKEYIKGFIDDVRLTVGRARYNGAFQELIAPFPEEQCTVVDAGCDPYWDDCVLLMHFDDLVEYHASGYIGDPWYTTKEDACALGAVVAYGGSKYGRHNVGSDTCEVFNDAGFTSLFTTWSYVSRDLFKDEKEHVFISSGGSPALTTDSSKFGDSSFEAGGVETDYVKADFDWFAQDTTIEFWAAKTASSGWEYTTVLASASTIGNHNPSGNGQYWSFGPINNGKIHFGYWVGTSWETIQTPDICFQDDGVWHHVALVHIFATGNISIFFDGEEQVSDTKVGTPESSTDYPLAIWRNYNNTPSGYLDELRITKQARYTEDFSDSLPTAPFSAESC